MSKSGIMRNAGIAVSLTFAALVAAGSLMATRDGGNAIVYGPATSIGEGAARVYIQLENGVPRELGVVLTESALNGLQHQHSPGGFDFPDGHRMFEKILELPEENPTPYRYVALGWNPGGHEPPGIYDQPHFDFHFYNAPFAQRQQMDPARAEFDAEAAKAPAPELVPTGYVQTPGAVAFMGAHWIDPTSPELNGAAFTRTFIYGTWDGAVIFAEPMITRDYLLSRPDSTFEVPVASAHAEPGYYPSRYRIRWVESLKEYHVALTGFEWRN
jgi:hypothetical protein